MLSLAAAKGLHPCRITPTVHCIFVGLFSEKVQAVYVQQSLKSEAKSSAERAADFRQRWLYGSRVNRQSGMVNNMYTHELQLFLNRQF